MQGSFRITRREFLEITGAVGALAAIASLTPVNPLGGIVEKSEAQATATAVSDQWVTGYCRMCMGAACSIRVHVVNGVAVKIEGDPNSPNNGKMLCVRGNSAIMNLYNPYRVKAPLKRTNPNKGLDQDPKWQEITWDEAIGAVGAALKTIRSSDPRQLIVHNGFGDFPDDNMVRQYLPNAFPTPNEVEANGPLCPVHYSSLSTNGAFTDNVDGTYCNYLISIGRSTGPNWVIAMGESKTWLDAIERGMKVVAVDPVCGEEASKAYRWVPIRPSTDLAFILGVIYTILYELNQYDVAFVKTRTNGPYLINASGDYARDATSGKPLVWDAVDNVAKTFDDATIKDYALSGSFTVGGGSVTPAFQLLKDHVKQYTPEWAEGISSVPAATIRTIASEFVSAAQIGSTITLNGVTLPFRPVAIIAGRGSIAHMNGTHLHMATKILGTLVGAMDVPGGSQATGVGPYLKPDKDGTVAPQLPPTGVVPQAAEWLGRTWAYPPQDVQLTAFYPNRHCVPQVMWRAIADPAKYLLPYTPQAIIIAGANAIQNNASPSEVETALKTIPLVVTVSYQFDEPAEFADIVLPEAGNLERTYEKLLAPASLTGGGKITSLPIRSTSTHLVRTPVVPAMYSSRQLDDIMIDVADSAGFLGDLNAQFNRGLGLKGNYALKATDKVYYSDLVDRRLKSLYGDTKGLDYFKANGALWTTTTITPEKAYNYFYYPGNQTRIPIYFWHLKSISDGIKANMAKSGVTVVPGWTDMNDFWQWHNPLPTWYDTPVFTPPAGYDLFVSNRKYHTSPFGLGGVSANPWLHEVAASTNPYLHVIMINSATAKSKGISDGDMVWVESQYGKLQAKAKVTDTVHPEVVASIGNYGAHSTQLNPIAQIGINYNQLLTSDEGYFEPVAGGIDNTTRVKVYKA